MNDYINFETFSSAFITLFTIALVDLWNYTIASFMHQKAPWNDCIDDPNYMDYLNNGMKNLGCGNRTQVMIFFISYLFIVNLVFLKLFIAIILKGYEQAQIQGQRLFNDEINEKFRKVWSEFDPDATSFIKLKDLRSFLFALGEPLGFDK